MEELYASPAHSHVVLKAPLHALYLDALCQGVPEGDPGGPPPVLVRTYRRDLAKVAMSIASLMRAIFDTVCAQYDLTLIERLAVDTVRVTVQQGRRGNELAAEGRLRPDT